MRAIAARTAAMPRHIATAFAIIALSVIGGCGQMGPLYMPNEAPQPAASAPDAPDQMNGDASAVGEAE